MSAGAPFARLVTHSDGHLLGGYVARDPQSKYAGTRQLIIDAAIAAFAENGYPATSLADITKNADLTKGAVYYYFASKEDLALSIIELTGSRVAETMRALTPSTTPAIDGMIRASIVLAHRLDTEGPLRVGIRLMRVFSGFDAATGAIYRAWRLGVADQLRRAKDEGDLRADVDTTMAAELIVSSILGTELLVGDEPAAVFRNVIAMWTVLIPILVTTNSVAYVTEHLERTRRRTGD
jgi:AcrR family transcriptional regulator